MGLGYVDIDLFSGGSKWVCIYYVYLEEDVGKFLYEDFYGMIGVDLNCVGILLIEVVIELDMNSVEEVVVFVKKLYSLVILFGICDGDMF